MRAAISFAVAAVALLAGAGLAHSQNSDVYPNRPVRVIVPFGAGGPGDLIARMLAQKLTESLGKPFYVENHPGAGGNIGTGLAARAPADGYTLVVISTTFVINASLYPKIPYDPIKDFDPVTIAVTSPNVIVVHPSVPARDVTQLIALVRAGKFQTFATPGVGTPAHMAGELFKQTLHLDFTAIPFGGGGPAIQSVIAGHTPVGFSALPPAMPQLKDGGLRALAVTSPARASLLPDVPTLGEAGVSDQNVDSPQGVLVPAGTPRPIIDLLYREIARIVVLPDMRSRFAAVGFEAVAITPEEYAARIRAELPKWAKVVRDSEIKPE